MDFAISLIFSIFAAKMQYIRKDLSCKTLFNMNEKLELHRGLAYSST